MSSLDDFGLDLCITVSRRSKDTTKHGAVVMARDGSIVSVGWNGPPASIDDRVVDWTRPNKYRYMVHAESNAMRYAGRSGCLGNVLYVTGKPCPDCVLEMASYRIAECVYGGQESKCLPEEVFAWSIKLAQESRIVLRQYQPTLKIFTEMKTGRA